MDAQDRKRLLERLLEDLAEESADLDRRVADLDEAGWLQPTPAAGWDIRDTVNHLAATDRDALQAIEDPEAFTERIRTAGGDYVEQTVARDRAIPMADVRARWRTGRRELTAAVGRLDPAGRIVWFGPAMGPASFVTARLMETWAHGQDVVDALGQHRPATHRLRSVAEIGVRARPFAYAAHGLATPTEPVRVELIGPSGEHWEWGPEQAPDRITGPALDFCLLVTQRRHGDDLALTVTGPHAQTWAGISQAFAGAPGSGRQPLNAT